MWLGQSSRKMVGDKVCKAAGKHVETYKRPRWDYGSDSE